MLNRSIPNHPLAEVFGFAPADMSEAAKRHRTKRLCPFNNTVPNCTKDKAQDPLGVCSVFQEQDIAITCPIRFRLPLLRHATERVNLAQSRDKFLKLICEQIGRNAANFEIFTFAIIKVHLEKFACRIYRDTRTSG